MGLYLFIMAIVAIACYGVYEFYTRYEKKTTMEQLAGPGEDNKNLNQIISVVYNQAQMGRDKAVTKNSVSKVLLMEDLNLRPKELKRYLGILTTKNLIKETVDSVTITPFGVQFYQVFQNDKLNLSSSR